MSKQGIIKTSTWSNTWSKNGNNVEYHKITLEGDNATYTIGSKDKNPSFLSVGQTLYYEEKDSKGNIKRVEAPQTNGGLGGSASFSDNSLGQQIGNALNVTAMLIAHGKIDVKELESTARRVVEISTKLKEEFSKPKTA